MTDRYIITGEQLDVLFDCTYPMLSMRHAENMFDEIRATPYDEAAIRADERRKVLEEREKDPLGMGCLMSPGEHIKVLVFEPDNPEEPKGIGTLVRREDLNIVDDEGMILDTIPGQPVIVMEDGEIVYGIECWWCPA